MPQAGPKKVQEYSAEFKLAAVRLSRQRGVQVQAVAAALDIHPFMLSRWRKAVRDGMLRGKRSEEHTSELQSRLHLVCRLLLEKKKKKKEKRSGGNEKRRTRNNVVDDV